MWHSEQNWLIFMDGIYRGFMALKYETVQFDTPAITPISFSQWTFFFRPGRNKEII